VVIPKAGTTTDAASFGERATPGRAHPQPIAHARHAKYRLARAGIDSYSRAMMKSTIGRLFELLMGPVVHSESEMAQVLGVDLMALRARLVDLKRRGILQGPLGHGSTATWKSWFPTLLATTLASERSGLDTTRTVPLRRAWWNDMWATA
jgi:hypothetical protein